MTDPLHPTPVADRCGECGLPLWPVGTGVYCANTACSMYARESTGADERRELPPEYDPGYRMEQCVIDRMRERDEQDDVLNHAPARTVRTLHLEVVTHDAKPARTVWEK